MCGGRGKKKIEITGTVCVEVSLEGTRGLSVMVVRREIIPVLQSTVRKREYEVFLCQQKNEAA